MMIDQQLRSGLNLFKAIYMAAIIVATYRSQDLIRRHGNDGILNLEMHLEL